LRCHKDTIAESKATGPLGSLRCGIWCWEISLDLKERVRRVILVVEGVNEHVGATHRGVVLPQNSPRGRRSGYPNQDVSETLQRQRERLTYIPAETNASGCGSTSGSSASGSTKGRLFRRPLVIQVSCWSVDSEASESEKLTGWDILPAWFPESYGKAHQVLSDERGRQTARVMVATVKLARFP
jgi:hypothetical protein